MYVRMVRGLIVRGEAQMCVCVHGSWVGVRGKVQTRAHSQPPRVTCIFTLKGPARCRPRGWREILPRGAGLDGAESRDSGAVSAQLASCESHHESHPTHARHPLGECP